MMIDGYLQSNRVSNELSNTSSTIIKAKTKYDANCEAFKEYQLFKDEKVFKNGRIGEISAFLNDYYKNNAF